MGLNKSKLLIEIGGMSVIERSVRAFLNIDIINDVIVTCRGEDMAEFKKIFRSKNVRLVPGGATRTESVYNAASAAAESDYIFIHDGARPLVEKETIYTVYEAALKYGAATAGTPLKDTVKFIDEEGKIVNTPPREKLAAVQTPQVFKFDTFKPAIEKAARENQTFTDDCALFESCGGQCYIAAGSYENIKITTKSDILLAKAILESRGVL
ncbi:MAG: 2-C-methyl-D-erythritol 4-phosphate cytidylyltransferase [Clostridiales bacterium]|nr:2-C-methyl-D-erythritol 4-phosphate cytidylyltransferase [Clostridiales bacterium]